MDINAIRDELEKMGVDYTENEDKFSNGVEVVVDMTDVSGSKARQIEYMCTTNDGLIEKRDKHWVISHF